MQFFIRVLNKLLRINVTKTIINNGQSQYQKRKCKKRVKRVPNTIVEQI